MAISDEVLLKFMQETTAAVSASSTSIASIEKRLFGNGQPGVIEKLYEHGEKLHADVSAKIDAHATDITALKAVRKSDKRVFHALAVFISGEAAFVGWLIHYYNNVITAAKAVLSHTIGGH